MRPLNLVAVLAAAAAIAALPHAADGADAKKPPEKLIFPAKMGPVTFDHAKHVERADKKCATCHTAVFPQDAKAPLNYKPAMHKTAEEKKISCATCHRSGEKAFPTKGNCAKCHKK